MREMRLLERASAEVKGRAVREISLTNEVRPPAILGRRESVPTSAARPMSTSLTEKVVLGEQRRMSHAVLRSMPRP